MGLISLNLKDLGGQPLVYDTVRGAIEQDPSIGGTNVYGSGDVFVSPSGAYVDYHTALAQAMVSAGKLTNMNSNGSAGVMVSSAGAGSNANQNNSTGQAVGSAGQTTIEQLTKRLMGPIWPDDPNSVPLIFVIGAAAGGYVLLKSATRRRR